MEPRGVPNKLTADLPYFNSYPVWSPEGNRIVFASSPEKGNTSLKLYLKSSTGVGSAEPLLAADPDILDLPQDWSSNGIVFSRFKLASGQSIDIWFLSMPDKKPSLYLHNGFQNVQAQVSPNGRYIAYATNESGSYQVVVQTFPNPAGGKWPITAQGGNEPLWKSDGRELYYLAPGGKIMAVAVTSDPTFQVGPPTELFQTTLTLTPANTPFLRRYAVSDDGQRFLVAAPSTASAASADSIPITAIVNWTATLQKK
jgi:Tol biopolymer transport system component